MFLRVTDVDMEEWKDVVGYEGKYIVSNFGRVSSIDRQVATKGGSLRVARGKRLKAVKHKSGYMVIGLCDNGSMTQHTVHSVVAIAHIGPRPDGHEVCHKDNNRENNSVENLRWGTKLENAEDKQAHGTEVIGERNGRAVLTEKCVISIIEMANNGRAQCDLAKDFGVGRATINHILRGRSWNHVTGIAPCP